MDDGGEFGVSRVVGGVLGEVLEVVRGGFRVDCT